MSIKTAIRKGLIPGLGWWIMVNSLVQAQNRGNDLLFQGWADLHDTSPRALAMGGAYSAMSGMVDVMNHNPAGLANVSKMQISLGGDLLNRKWTENQVYYPNRLFYTLPFYLEHLYIPDPANNGKRDHLVFYQGLLDTAYVVALPDTGLEPYSDAAADWLVRERSANLAHLQIAYPFKIGGKNLVVALACNTDLRLSDYDRNDTYLDPHLGYIEYNMPRIVTGLDTITMNWSVFRRKRAGQVREYQVALALHQSQRVQFGFSLSYLTGRTRDEQHLDKVGYFQLFDQNDFAFSYDTLNLAITGKSTFSAVQTNLGTQLVFEAFSVGLNLHLPYTVERRAAYTQTVNDTAGTRRSSLHRTDKLRIPLGYTCGVSFRPAAKFIFNLDYAVNRYSQAEWRLDSDTTYRRWVDQTILAFGIQYAPFTSVALRGGYRLVPQVYVPDGAAFRDRGPSAHSWTLGMGLKFGQYGCLDLAWEQRTLKYFEQYFSNVNYSKQVVGQGRVAYSYEF